MSKTRILIADDDVRFTKALTIRLEEMGYEVLATVDAYHALAKTVAQKPDVLILDIHMPAGDGFSVLERIQKSSELGDVPTIYVSGDTSEKVERAAASAGAVALLHKPIELRMLRQWIQVALKSKAA